MGSAAFNLIAPTPLLAEPMTFSPVLEVAPPQVDVDDGANSPPLPTADDDEEEDPLAAVATKVDDWAERNQLNLRVLLASLHEVTPRGWGWEATPLSALVGREGVLRA